MSFIFSWVITRNSFILSIVRKHIYIIFVSAFSLILNSCKQSVITSWYYNKINARFLLSKEKEKDIVIGVLDSIINKDFKIFFNEDTFIDGYDFVDNDSEPYTEFNLHGSYISYLIAGKEYDGLSGIDSRLKIMPIRVFDESGNTSDDLIYQGLKYAIEHGCDVINMSYASSKYNQRNDTLIQNNTDIKYIASVGDFSSTEFCYPALYDNVIAISAVDESDNLYTYSNTSKNKDSILVPGVMLPILSVHINDDVIKTLVSGSSFSTAIMSGVIGSLLLSRNLNEEALLNNEVYTNDYFDCRKLILNK